MPQRPQRLAILFPAGPERGVATSLMESRHAETARAFAAAGIEVIGAPYADAFVDEIRARLRGVGAVLVWFNPTEGGRDRTTLNAMLRDLASSGVLVSVHPDAIDRIGTKEVLFRTRDMAWGGDTRLYRSAEAMREGLTQSLRGGASRVLKRLRGQSGDGIWKVQWATAPDPPASTPPADALLRVRPAARGGTEETPTLREFVARFAGYFAASGGIVDQAYQPRLTDGMVRCYLVRDRVAGFGEQLVNLLHPTAPPGPRLYYPPTRPDFARLKEALEREWVAEMCRRVGLEPAQLPVLWDADFLYGPKDAAGHDTYVLCEINVSSVYPFPPDALGPLVAETMRRMARTA